MKRFFNMLAKLEKGIANKRTSVIVRLQWKLSNNGFKARIYLLKGDDEELYTKFNFKFDKFNEETVEVMYEYLWNRIKEAYTEEDED